MPLVVSIVSLMLSYSRCYRLPLTFPIDNPEYGPGAIFGASGVYTSFASASSTDYPIPIAGAPNPGAILGGLVGGLAVVSIGVAAIFYLRRRLRASSARSAGTDAFQPHMDEIPRTPSDGETVGSSSIHSDQFLCTCFSFAALHFSVLMDYHPISVHPGRAE